MPRADDIANLFQCIGVSPSGYREMSSLLGTARTLESLPVDISRPGLANALPQNAVPQAKRAVQAQVVVVASANGGVGKSTVAAALAMAFNRGSRTYAIDLDPQNALTRHFALRTSKPGLVQFQQGSATWQEIVHNNALGGLCLPFGACTHEQQREFERTLHDNPDWLACQLAQLHTSPRDTLVIDTPTGSSVYLDQALAIADLVLMVTTPAAASYHALPRLEHILKARQTGHPRVPLRYVINQLDTTRDFSQSMLAALRKRLGPDLLGVIQHDHFLAESMPSERPTLGSLPSTKGGLDLLDLARTLQLALSQPQLSQLSTS
ncbi:TPA: cellulose synthase operon protein YhjQ [Pseudomonas putida]|nr:cellulose synthase operon protein YhjQ [Pseudomonas putida]